jgi:hypothetical protein
LREFLDLYKVKEYKETPLIDNFETIAQIIADANYEGDSFKASLLMVYDVCVRKEMEKMEATPLENSNNHRSGLECMNFFFDLINEIAGYTEKYYEETRDVISHEGLIMKYRAEKAKFDQKQAGTLLADDSPHCLMVIESI